MELVTKGRVLLFKPVYIQHSAMIHDARIAKLRVVFDASNKTRDDTSLSEVLIGPKLQQDLPSTIVRGHGHSVHVADISRMFLQIFVDSAISMDAAIMEKIAAKA